MRLEAAGEAAAAVRKQEVDRPRSASESTYVRHQDVSHNPVVRELRQEDTAIDPAAKALLRKKIPGREFAAERNWLREKLGSMGLKIPTLFKHYTDVCMAGGVRFCGFNVDPAFNNCVDGLVMIDLRYLKPKKRTRYIGTTQD